MLPKFPKRLTSSIHSVLRVLSAPIIVLLGISWVILLMINAPPSVFKCDPCDHVPFKLMNFLQQWAIVNQVMARVSLCKKKMFSRNVDQRVKM